MLKIQFGEGYLFIVCGVFLAGVDADLHGVILDGLLHVSVGYHGVGEGELFGRQLLLCRISVSRLVLRSKL